MFFFEKYEPGVYHDLNNCVCRNAEDEEKDKLYNAIGKHFTEEYDKDWYNHFTDSSYFDIQDYLLDVFNIEVDETLCTTSWYPSFVNDIQQYIWDKLCKAHNEVMGVPNTVEDKPEMVNKQEFINKTISYFTPILKTYCSEECVKELMDGFVNLLEE